MRLILASASPRRAELLRAAGFEFETIVTDIDESVRPGESPSMYVRRLSSEKSAAAQAAIVARPFKGGDPGGPERPAPQHQTSPPPDASGDAIVVAADTAVVVANEILGKPRDDRDAAAMLRRLSGRAHEVLTGVSVRRGAVELKRVETTYVRFAELSDEEVKWYVASGEGRDKAGAYAIQGLASRFIPRIDGSYSNVVGLPVACVHELLREISGTRRGRSSGSASGGG
jgi:septum formation protein